MNPPETNQTRTCSDCGATLPETADSCWLCKRSVVEGQSPFSEEPISSIERRAAFQFSIATMMMLVTLCAVIMGAFSVSPGLGIALAVLAAPAWLRTCMVAARRRGRGRPMTAQEKMWAFGGSLGVVAAIVIAAGIAFYATCWAGFFGGAAVSSLWSEDYGPIGWGLFTGVGLGVAGGIYVGRRMIRRFWIRKN